jgi:antibiotic biosynthesis monooxygenase (ABM) superfamily enzyme
MPDEGATVVITHRVREGQEAAYEEWLSELGPVSRRSAGQLDWQIIRPVAASPARSP